MLIDTHTHVNSEELLPTSQSIIKSCLDQEIWMVNVGTDELSSRDAIRLAESYEDGVYASVGIHPTSLGEIDFNTQKIQDLAGSSSKVVALGETGLDYYRLSTEEFEESKKLQEQAFRSTIRLANQLNLALIVHLRSSPQEPHRAYEDALAILREEKAGRGVIHCFGGNVEQAKQFIELGFCIGITGIVTFKNAEITQQVAKLIPLEYLVVETDAPYLAPEPYRGRQNTPEYLPAIVEAVARLRGLSIEKIAHETTINARRMYVI